MELIEKMCILVISLCGIRHFGFNGQLYLAQIRFLESHIDEYIISTLSKPILHPYNLE